MAFCLVKNSCSKLLMEFIFKIFCVLYEPMLVPQCSASEEMFPYNFITKNYLYNRTYLFWKLCPQLYNHDVKMQDMNCNAVCKATSLINGMQSKFPAKILFTAFEYRSSSLTQKYQPQRSIIRGRPTFRRATPDVQARTLRKNQFLEKTIRNALWCYAADRLAKWLRLLEQLSSRRNSITVRDSCFLTMGVTRHRCDGHGGSVTVCYTFWKTNTATKSPLLTAFCAGYIKRKQSWGSIWLSVRQVPSLNTLTAFGTGNYTLMPLENFKFCYYHITLWSMVLLKSW